MARDRILNESEYDEIVSTFNWSDENKMICKKVMVDGLGVTEVANHFGKSRQRVNTLVHAAWSEFVKKSPTPAGWVRIVVDLPKEMADDILAKSHELLTKEILREALTK